MLASVSLWLSGWRGSKSSIHYDAFHNLLVVVAGEKRVLLWPPAETASLHPHQLGGESGNHSGVDMAQPDRYTGFGEALGRAVAVTLHAGDALFIPEGFWHQVGSSSTTIAVNYWRVADLAACLGISCAHATLFALHRWRSAFSDRLGGHMDAYFARRALESLVVAEKKRLLMGDSGDATSAPRHRPAHDDGAAGAAKRVRVDPAVPRPWEDETALSPDEKEAFSRMGLGKWEGNLGSEGNSKDDERKWNLDLLLRDYPPTTVQNLLGYLAAKDPCMLHGLVNKHLTPRTAEALTVAFEEADRLRGGGAASDGPTGFYYHFYAAMDDDMPDGTFLAKLLSMKEQFAAQATKNVLATVLGAPESRTDESVDE